MHTDRRSVMMVLGSLLAFAANGCGMRSNLDEGDSTEEITVASVMDAGTEEDSFCGDGRLDLANEQCDGNNLGYASCESLGEGVGILRCSPGCYFDVTMCHPAPISTIENTGTQTTTPIWPGQTSYGSDPFSDMINQWLNRRQDAGVDEVDEVDEDEDAGSDDNT